MMLHQDMFYIMEPTLPNLRSQKFENILLNSLIFLFSSDALSRFLHGSVSKLLIFKSTMMLHHTKQTDPLICGRRVALG